MNVDELPDECRRVTRRVQTNIDECRRIEIFTLISESDTWSHFSVVAIMQHKPHQYLDFQFYSFIYYYCSSVFSLLTLAKPICLFLHLTYVYSN